GPRDRHELQIIDDYQVEPVLALDTPRSGAQLRRSESRSFIDENPRFRQLTRCARDTYPVVVRNVATAQTAERHATDGCQHARDELLGRHFQAEDANRCALRVMYGGVLRHVDREGTLAHRRS